MYADKVDADSRRSIKDRLNGSTADTSVLRRPISGKRRREDDDKWEHDLFEHDHPQLSNRRIGERDLRLKLQRKSVQQTAQSVKGSLSGMRDLREKLSGISQHPIIEPPPPRARQKPVSEVSKPVRSSVVAEAPVTESKKVSSSVSRKKNQNKSESIDSFLQSLGLEKYSITFQAEEVDMTALIHMTDDDLKAMGIPMGPRKKVLLALESKV